MRVAFPKPLRKRLRRELARAGRVEIGGVLMAEQLAPGEFRLVDFTVDRQQGSAAHFVRSVEEHQRALEEFFERTGHDYARFNYIGEWHSHPNHSPVPSREDVASMESLVHGERDIPFALLMIFRTRWCGLALSATLFERTGPPRPVSVNPRKGR
ncbi:Mov34/MPN/PAD-1 family protein [Sphingomonas jaspsi]|uniref:Mov34/MPN/PAD-1 family protein n=1 Tax=Sphingomonas jaspsi TaxID=392409 RepID=UPI000561415F|nr:Mov34/MPN/PAD-1 family protein [Sphingomonas jaspsi]